MTDAAKRPDVGALLNPRNIVLVGASDRPGHWSERVWRTLGRFGFPGVVWPVNPNRREIWGVPCHAGLDALPEAPDHLALFVPAEATLEVLEQGARLGARSATLYAAGFGEGDDPVGRERAARLAALVAQSGLAVAGPNCMGVAAGRSRLVTFADEVLQPLAPGKVAIVTQSGAMCGSFSRAVNDLDLDVAYLISCGNQVGLTIADYLDHLADDPALRVIFCYIESVRDPARFLAAARRVRAAGKTIVAVKIGGSDAGRAAALAHTGSLAGGIAAFDAVTAAAGIVRVESIEEAIGAIDMLARTAPPRGPAIAVMTNSGALCSLVTEAATRTGATLAALSPATRAGLAAALGETAPGNPVDSKRTLPSDVYIGCVELLAQSPEVDILLLAEEFPRAPGIDRKVANLRALEAWVAAHPADDKTAAVALFSPLALADTEYGRALRQELPHLPFLKESEKTLRLLHMLGEAGARRPAAARGDSSPVAAEILARWRARAAGCAGPTALSEVESKALIAAYGIVPPRECVVPDAAAAVRAANEIGYPVVLKAVSAAVAHKSDVGLVVLGLTDGEAVARAAEEINRRLAGLGVVAEGLLVARQLAGGIEAVLGIHRDPEMGPVVMVGLGGVWVELFNDVAFGPPGLDTATARAMIAATRLGRLLAGYRGGAAGDGAALVEALIRLGRLAADLGDVLEAVDINPFRIGAPGQGGCALDALAVLRPPA